MNIFELFNNKPSVRTGPKKYSPIVETIGPDRNDPYEQGWRARPGYDFNPYAKDTAEYQKWEDGQAERQAQPNHYDEGVADDMPDLEEVGEPVESIMDAERRMAAGDRIFAAHEMDEEPFEIFNVSDLAGYTYDQILAVPQGVAEGYAGADDTDTVGFHLETERAYQAVMGRYGDMIDHDETSGIMYAPARIWPKIEMVAFDADGVGATRDDDLENPEHYGVAEEWSKKYKDSINCSNPKGFSQKAHCAGKKKNEDVVEADRNELDTPTVQDALKNMAARHKREKWSTEQLAALGRRLAAQDKESVSGTNQTEDQWHGEDNAWSDGKGQWSDGRGQWSESIDPDVAEYLSEMKSAGYDIK